MSVASVLPSVLGSVLPLLLTTLGLEALRPVLEAALVRLPAEILSVGAVVMLIVALCVLVGVHGRQHRRRIAERSARLMEREPLPDDEYFARHYAGTPADRRLVIDIRRSVAAHLGVPNHAVIRPNDRFRDLPHPHELAGVELSLAVEELIGRSVPTHDFNLVHTVDDLTFLAAYLAAHPTFRGFTAGRLLSFPARPRRERMAATLEWWREGGP